MFDHNIILLKIAKLKFLKNIKNNLYYLNIIGYNNLVHYQPKGVFSSEG